VCVGGAVGGGGVGVVVDVGGVWYVSSVMSG